MIIFDLLTQELAKPVKKSDYNNARNNNLPLLDVQDHFLDLLCSKIAFQGNGNEYVSLEHAGKIMLAALIKYDQLMQKYGNIIEGNSDESDTK